MTEAVIAALVGAVLGSFLAFRFAISLAERREASIAKAAYRAAFAPSLAFIYIAQKHGNHDRPNIDAHIKDALLAHGAAVEIFRVYVPKRQIRDYQNAWEDYRLLAAEDPFPRTGEEEESGIQIGDSIKLKIHALLRFAV